MSFITAVSSNCSKYVSWLIVHCFSYYCVIIMLKKWNYRITVICLFLLAVNKIISIQYSVQLQIFGRIFGQSEYSVQP